MKLLPRWPVVALYLACALAYASVTPIFESPDEPSHFRNLLTLLDQHRLPDASPVDLAGNGHAVFEGHQAPLFYLLASVPLWAARAATGWRGVEPNPSGRPGPDGYAAPNLYRHALPHRPLGDAPFGPVFWVRLFSILLGAVAVLAAYEAGRLALPEVPWAGAATGLAVGLDPQFAFISASVNNDALAAAIGSLLVYGCLRVICRRSIATRDCLLLGALVGAGALTKSSLLVLAPLPLIAITWTRPGLRTAIGRAALTFAVAAGVSGWWPVRNLVVHHDPLLWKLQVARLPALYATRSLSAPYFVTAFPSYLFRSFWGFFGWMNVPLPMGAYLGCVAASLLSLAGLLLLVKRRPAFPTRAGLAVGGAASGLSFAALVAYNLSFAQPQGRLLFPAVTGIALVLVIGLASLSELLPARARSLPPVLLLAGLLTLNLLGLRQIAAAAALN